jgi:hypothetical protein
MVKQHKLNIDPEKYISEHAEQIDNAADKIYFCFSAFGWEWGNQGRPSREEIYKQIEYLVRLSLKEGNQVGTGRISVDTSEWLMIMLEV